MAFCPNCGSNVPDNTTQCPQCGAAMNAQQPQQNAAPQGNYQQVPPQNYQQVPPQGQPYQQMPPQGNPYQQQVPPQAPMGPAPIPPGYQPKSKLAAGLLGIFLGQLAAVVPLVYTVKVLRLHYGLPWGKPKKREKPDR